MSRRHRDGDEPQGDGQGFNAPFRDLKKLVRIVPSTAETVSSARRGPTPAERPRRPAAPPERSRGAEPDDDALFRAAVAGAVPLATTERSPAPPAPPRSTPLGNARENAAALAELTDLVAGGGVFDVSDSDEYVEGAVAGLDPRVVRKLRSGDFSYQCHLDLHGLTVDGAKLAVRQFVLRGLRAGHRCLLLIHGRGHNSREQRPVLKEALKSWLTRGELAQVVLAFTSARPCDGGAGALYVLLRRERRPRKPFRTLDGAKS